MPNRAEAEDAGQLIALLRGALRLPQETTANIRRALRGGQGSSLLDLIANDTPDAPGLDAVLIQIDAPWDQAFGEAERRSQEQRGRRVFGVSTCAWQGGVWHDGPLWHARRDGQIASFLPSGGDGALALPWRECSAEPRQPLTWADARTMEGSVDEQEYRCLIAQLGARLDLLIPPATRSITYSTAAFSRKDAVLLMALCAARPTLARRVEGPPDWPVGWRRLCENAGLTRRAGPADAHLALAQFHDAFPDNRSKALAAIVNRTSDLIPRRLAVQDLP